MRCLKIKNSKFRIFIDWRELGAWFKGSMHVSIKKGDVIYNMNCEHQSWIVKIHTGGEESVLKSYPMLYYNLPTYETIFKNERALKDFRTPLWEVNPLPATTSNLQTTLLKPSDNPSDFWLEGREIPYRVKELNKALKWYTLKNNWGAIKILPWNIDLDTKIFTSLKR